jgi:diguanylate cyclase (GGDEF)-like protein/PAS domain S-box-containing protein
MAEPIKILVVEDDEADAEMAQRELRRGGFEFQSRQVQTESDFRRELDEFQPHLIISDFSMPQFDGPTALAITRESHPDIPFIFMSGTIGENVAVDMLKAGADDYVMKNNLVRLLPAIERELREADVRRGRKLAEEALRASEEKFRQLAESVREVFWLTDPAKKEMLYVSPAYEEIWGRSLQSLRDSPRTWLDAIHPEDRQRVLDAAVAKQARGDYDEEYRIVRADGSVRWIHDKAFPIRDKSGAVFRIAGVAEDITEQKRAADEVRRLAERLAMTLESITDGFFTLDREWRFTFLNNAAERQLQRTRADLLGKIIWDEFKEVVDTASDREYRQAMRTMRTAEFEQYYPPLGKWFEARAYPSDEGLAVYFRDVTERKVAEIHIKNLNRVYAVLSGINALIVRVRDRDELFREACRIAVDSGKFRMAWIGVVDSVAMQVRPLAWAGDVRDFFDSAPLAVTGTQPGGHGLAGRAVREMKPMISNDVQNDPQKLMRKECEERGINSLAVIPLMVGIEAVGVLALYAADVGFFDDEEMKLLLELAGDISFALDHLEKEEKIEYLAFYDSLTGLANRTLFHERLAQYVSAAQSNQSKLALAIVDVDRFKTINDSLGRQAGDELLKQIAERIARYVDPSRLARISADRFAVVRPAVSSESEVARFIEQWLAECFGPPYVVNGTELRLSAKAGVALFPNDGPDAEALFRNAEAALKKAKVTGERYLFHTPQMTEMVGETLTLENKLRQALEKEEFVLYYQPKVDTATRRIESVEALIRWQSPELGLVPPTQFIPLLEETGLILEVGAWALRRAVLDHRHWTDLGLSAPRIAVNVSSVQMRQGDFVATVEEAIKLGLVPPGIDIEITESLVMEDLEANMKKLESVRLLGVSLAIDDFGTGYSSLRYLAKLPVHSLKIDRSFIITMLKDPAVMTLVSTIISMAHSLRLKVVAEGVDAEEQAKVLDRLGCDQMQGYLFSKPIPRDQIEKLLARLPQPSSRKAEIRRRRRT